MLEEYSSEELFADVEEMLKRREVVYKIAIEFDDAIKYEYVAIMIKKLKQKWKLKDKADVLERLIRIYAGGDKDESM